MSQDIISDTLNEIMNAKKAGKNMIFVKRSSKLLTNVLEIAKKHKYISEFGEKSGLLEIKFNLNKCKAIKPRFQVQVEEIEKYVRRFLPARDFGIIIISTSSGLMVHEDAYEKNLGGSLIAYFY